VNATSNGKRGSTDKKSYGLFSDLNSDNRKNAEHRYSHNVQSSKVNSQTSNGTGMMKPGYIMANEAKGFQERHESTQQSYMTDEDDNEYDDIYSQTNRAYM
jgi:hypothetical protein